MNRFSIHMNQKLIGMNWKTIHMNRERNCAANHADHGMIHSDRAAICVTVQSFTGVRKPAGSSDVLLCLGMKNENVLPAPIALCTAISPPCASTICLQKTRPIPVEESVSAW